MADEDTDLQELRRLASLAGFVPYATTNTPWPAPRERSVQSLNRHVHLTGERVRTAAVTADPNGYLEKAQADVIELIRSVDAWTEAWVAAVDSLADADDVASHGVERAPAEAALSRLDRAAGDLRHVGKVYLAAWGDFHSEPYPYAIAPLTNVALYTHRWFREIVRRRGAADTLTVILTSVSRYHWGVQNVAGTVADTTFPGVTDWMREVGAFVDALLAMIVEVTVAAETVVRYHQ